MLENLIRRATAMTVFLAVIVGVWLAAWCKSVEAESDRRYYSPLPGLTDPSLYCGEVPTTQPAR